MSIILEEAQTTARTILEEARVAAKEILEEARVTAKIMLEDAKVPAKALLEDAKVSDKALLESASNIARIKEIMETTKDYDIDDIVTKINTMWAFQVRRAIPEVLSLQLGSISAPHETSIQFGSDARKLLNPIRNELISFYNSLPDEIKKYDGDVLLAIESKFGKRLLDIVCIPCGLSHGACLLLAMSVAKETSEITLNL